MAEQIINLPDKLDGQQVSADEYNIIKNSLNLVYDEAKKKYYAFSETDFIVSGTTVIDGQVYQRIVINPAVVSSTTYLDTTQFDGDGTLSNPYKIKAGLIGGGGNPQLATPALGLTANGSNAVNASWTSVANASGYVLQRATNAGFSANLTNLYTGTLLAYADSGLTQNTLYYYRVQATPNSGYTASSYGANSITTPTPGNITPTPPVLAADDSANTLSATHGTYQSAIVFSTAGGSYVPYTGTISVGDVARAAGYWKFKISSAAGRDESAVVDSPAFTVAGSAGNLLPGYTAVAALNGLIDFNQDGTAETSPGIFFAYDHDPQRLTPKYQLTNGDFIAYKLGATEQDALIGVLPSYTVGTPVPWGIGCYIDAGVMHTYNQTLAETFVDWPSTPYQANDYFILRWNDNGTTQSFTPFRSTNGTTITEVTPPVSLTVTGTGFVPGQPVYFAIQLGRQVPFLYPQGSGLTLVP